MKWCNRYCCWCDEVESDNIGDCELNCLTCKSCIDLLDE